MDEKTEIAARAKMDSLWEGYRDALFAYADSFVPGAMTAEKAAEAYARFFRAKARLSEAERDLLDPLYDLMDKV